MLWMVMSDGILDTGSKFVFSVLEFTMHYSWGICSLSRHRENLKQISAKVLISIFSMLVICFAPSKSKASDQKLAYLLIWLVVKWVLLDLNMQGKWKKEFLGSLNMSSQNKAFLPFMPLAMKDQKVILPFFLALVEQVRLHSQLIQNEN